MKRHFGMLMDDIAMQLYNDNGVLTLNVYYLVKVFMDAAPFTSHSASSYLLRPSSTHNAHACYMLDYSGQSKFEQPSEPPLVSGLSRSFLSKCLDCSSIQ